MTQTTTRILCDLIERILAPHRQMKVGEASATLNNIERREWLRVIALAEAMEVSGLAYDAMVTLAKEQQPDVEVAMRWTANVQATERDNRLMRERFAACMERFEAHGLEPIVMKGMTLSALYPNPLHRPVGDIDLYVPLDQQHRYLEAFREMGGKVADVFDLKHLSVECFGMNWELHFRGMLFYNGVTNRRYKLFEQEETMADALYHEEIDGHTVSVFPPILKIVYLTAHFQHHLLMERVTLRQMVDWMLALHQERTALGIAEVSLVRTLNEMGLYRLYRALGYAAKRHLGFDSNWYAGLTNFTPREKRRGERLLKIVLNGHIPGCKPYRPRLETDSWLIRIGQYIELWKRCLVVWRFCPREALATPFGFLYYAFKRRWAEFSSH